MRASRRNWNVNLQKVKVVVDGKPQTIRISARALKNAEKQKSYLRVDMKHGNLFFSFFRKQGANHRESRSS